MKQRLDRDEQCLNDTNKSCVQNNNHRYQDELMILTKGEVK